MEEFAGKMAKQCVGLPLAIVVLGGILATKHELKEWEKVGASVNLFLKRGEQKGNDGVASVLESSYRDLPYYLKSCFLYFSQYREDEEIKATKLIQRWVGEGFVASSMENGDETMEDVAEGYLNELVSRCVIQVERRGHTGRVKTCRIHDLMWDLCISKAKEEGFSHTIDLRVENEGTVGEKVCIIRRLCIFSGGSRYKPDRFMLSSIGDISPQLRSITFRNVDDQDNAVGLIINKLKLVRVVEHSRFNSYSTWKTWRGHIGNLIHLRLLDIDLGYGIPKSIGNLRCLQTLNLESGSKYLVIPDSVWGMERLRHLYLPRYGGICESSNQQRSNIQNLQTLVNFPPMKFDLQQSMIKLTGVRKLVINHRWEEKDKFSMSSEIVFNRLQSLSFKKSKEYVALEDFTRGSPGLYRLVVRRPIKFPETATCSSIWPSNLTKLVLRRSLMDERHMGTLAELQSLKILFLTYKSFIGKEMSFHKNDFPQLRHLKLQNLQGLEEWRVHEGALPSLVCLEIINCSKLKSVADGSRFLKRLKELKVTLMPASFKRRLEQDWDRASRVPSVSFFLIYPGR